MGHQLRTIALLSALVFGFVSGCGNKDEPKAATQVAARVNGEEITVHQINNVLARTPNIPPETATRAKREILDRLIDQQIARQQAVEKKLDRTPNVVQAIEAMKTDLLARSFLEQVASAEAKPTPEEVKKYDNEHPELFAQRRIFQIEEVVAKKQDGVVAGVKDQAQKTRSIQGIAAWLRSRNSQFAQNERFIASEEIPLNAVSKVHATKEGEIQITEGPDTVSAFRIVSSRPAPVDEPAATPRIQQFIYTQRANEAVTREMKRLKEKSKVEYLGEFAESAAATLPKAPAAANSTPPQAPDFEKGVRGLK